MVQSDKSIVVHRLEFTKALNKEPKDKRKKVAKICCETEITETIKGIFLDRLRVWKVCTILITQNKYVYDFDVYLPIPSDISIVSKNSIPWTAINPTFLAGNILLDWINRKYSFQLITRYPLLHMASNCACVNGWYSPG